MHPKHHAFWGFLASLILINYFGVTDFNALIFWLSSWFIIDLDHSIRYVFRTKNINPFKFWEESKIEKKKRLSENINKIYPVFVFHSIEFLLLILIVAQLIPIMIYVFWGFLFHLVCDWIMLLIEGLDVFSKVSLIYLMIRNKNKKSLMN